MADPAKKSEPTPTDPRRLGEVVIELGDDKNRNVSWPITKVVLRGAWKRGNMPHTTMHQSVAGLPDMPGVYVSCDPSRRRARVFDPLSEPQNADLLAKCQRVHREAFHTEAGPQPAVSYDELTDGEVKTWLYYMRQHVKHGKARVVYGELPSEEQIQALPGKTRTELHNTSLTAPKYREDVVNV